MTKTNTSKFILRKLIFMWLLVLPVIYFAQNSGTYIKWNFQVGCAENASEYDPKNDNGVLFENIERSECIRVCEGSTVTYTVEGTNISNVQWNVSGGSLQSTSGAGNSIAIIQWGSVGTGAIQITITYSNGTTENRSLCIDKINSPRARFILAGNAEPRVCRNTPVYFTNLSEQNGGSDIVYYHWDFDDGTPPSSAFEPVHTFTDPGVYNVTLTVTNKCNCSHKYSMKVEVVKSEPVKISCPSVVCEGSVATYTADDNCGGDWEVIGGTIISNSGTSIQVKWDHVDPAEGFGYVLYRSHCNCPEWVTVKVPVVLGKVEIKVNRQFVLANNINMHFLNGLLPACNGIFQDLRERSLLITNIEMKFS
ncbi:PKD domain-containing protein [Chryseobacterium arachidis]|uniref:PKD domain-containing protein n=1 Tax=Chryseobacterium arachidis TaxID=1416778 RepID=UPI0036099BBF